MHHIVEIKTVDYNFFWNFTVMSLQPRLQNSKKKTNKKKDWRLSPHIHFLLLTSSLLFGVSQAVLF